jgi:outer membrane protein TolC
LGIATLAAQERTITLEEALELAERVQPGIVQARGFVRSADAALRTNTGSFLPSLSLSASSSNASSNRFNSATGQIVSAPSSSSYSGGIGLSLDLFEGFRRFNQRDAARADVAAADASLTNEQYLAALVTKQSFFAALATQELVRVAERRIERAEQQLSVSVDKLRAGAATRSDSLRSRVELGSAQLALLRAEADLAAAQANLGRQIGVGGRVAAAFDTTLLAPLGALNLNALVAEAIGGAPRVLLADADASAAASQVSVARGSYWPTLSASYSNGYSGFEAPWGSTEGYVNNWSFRFSLSWTIFNGFQREGQIVNAGVQRDNAQARAADTRRDVHAQVIRLTADLESAWRAIEIADGSLIAAQEDLRVQQERYGVGAATIVELLTSQVALDEAEVEVVRARYDYVVARAQLEALIGRSL